LRDDCCHGKHITRALYSGGDRAYSSLRKAAYRMNSRNLLGEGKGHAYALSARLLDQGQALCHSHLEDTQPPISVAFLPLAYTVHHAQVPGDRAGMYG